jgi:ABC-type glycerol-3-phosphate transport system permease component
MTPNPVARVAAYAVAIAVSLLFLYPYWWMLLGAFRSTEAVLTEPLRLWPESWSLDAFHEIARIGGEPLWLYALNSVVLTTLSSGFGAGHALGAYALGAGRACRASPCCATASS